MQNRKPEKPGDNAHVKAKSKQSPLTARVPARTLTGMEIHFPPDKEARLQQLAARTGRNPAQLVEEALDRMFDYDERFIAAVEEGRTSARRGNLLDHDEVVQRVEQMLRS
jgi:predicted transcriptional regulator